MTGRCFVRVNTRSAIRAFAVRDRQGASSHSEDNAGHVVILRSVRDSPPPAETGLWWYCAAYPSRDLGDWSQPVQIMSAADRGWHAGQWKPCARYGETATDQLLVFFSGSYSKTAARSRLCSRLDAWSSIGRSPERRVLDQGWNDRFLSASVQNGRLCPPRHETDGADAWRG